MAPDKLFSMTRQQIEAMSDYDLVQFALNDLSLVFPLEAPRGVILTKIFNAAYVIRDV